MTDGAVLPLPQKHQADHYHSCYGHCNHQQANECAAPEAEVLSQGAVWLLQVEEQSKEMKHELTTQEEEIHVCHFYAV